MRLTFGYVIANKNILTPEQFERYRGRYCGLCRALKAGYGHAVRFTLTYDMVFLSLVLSSLYEPEQRCGREKCLPHPVKPHLYIEDDISDYCAGMNLILAYHSLKDNWDDDRSLQSRICMSALNKSYARACEKYPYQAEQIISSLGSLRDIETKNIAEPDPAANAFGEVMAAAFSYGDGYWKSALMDAGRCLGRFIYLMDACIDLEKDIKKGSYNPLRSMEVPAGADEPFLPFLKLLMAECAEKFDLLPLVRDKDLIDNILYSGVWLRYEMAKSSRKANK